MEAKMKTHRKQQDSNKKVLHVLHHFLLIEELITKCWSQKVLYMGLHLHLIPFLKLLPNISIMNSKITKEAFKKPRSSKIYWILNHQITTLAFLARPQTGTETMKMRTILVAASTLKMRNINNKLFKKIWILQMFFAGHMTS